MTKIKLALLAAAVFTPAAAFAQAVPPAVIAVVDTARIFGTCTACVAANSQTQALVTQAQTRATALGTPLQTQQQALETEATRVRAMPDGAAKNTAASTLNQRVQAFQAQQASAQQEVERLRNNIESTRQNVLRQLSEKLNPVITSVMTQRGANIAMDQQATLAAAKGVDVTDAVLAALNQAVTSVSVTPLPATAAPATPRPAGR
ncbi:OmpH family outer membrane protein [Sphingomonas antarctica]|uniref:OmpH family outer membrane protein n=1 Tax=Sphingomonas antarctica TaxID=2040274 RepID=UPI0039E8B059